MRNPETIKKCRELIAQFLHNTYAVSYDDLKAEFEEDGDFIRLIDAKMGPYDISVDVDLEEGFVRYSAILPVDENSRMLVDSYYENEEEMLMDMETLDYMSWMDTAIIHLREVVRQ